MPASGASPLWRDFGIKLASLGAGLFAARPIGESLGWPDETLYRLAVLLPVMVVVHLALQRIFPARA